MDDRIECREDVMMGKPVIVGTRITVEFLLESLAAGESIGDKVAEYTGKPVAVAPAPGEAARSLQ